jgi:hypothetical protein
LIPFYSFVVLLLINVHQVVKQEGPWSLYRALLPRLLAVVPMIGVQFAVYELVKRFLLDLPPRPLPRHAVSPSHFSFGHPADENRQANTV